MNIDEFDAVFDRFRVSAFRLETLPRYADDEDEEFALFLAGQPLPERSTRTVPWLRRVAETTAAGKRWRRVHVLRQPLTDYLRFELIGYQANVEAGEDIRIADLGAHPELAALHRDFWLFDAETPDAFAMPMHYDNSSHLVGFDLTDDPEVMAQYRYEHDLALACSAPLHEYTATLDVLSPATVSRIESGDRLIRLGELDTWVRTTGASAAVRDELATLAESAANQITPWPSRLPAGIDRTQQEAAELEADAATILGYDHAVVHGLLQIHDYARLVLELATVGSKPNIAEATPTAPTTPTL
ncbi:MAG: DUF6879 family protein [Pseudonocardiaceae bacterium]